MFAGFAYNEVPKNLSEFEMRARPKQFSDARKVVSSTDAKRYKDDLSLVDVNPTYV